MRGRFEVKTPRLHQTLILMHRSRFIGYLIAILEHSLNYNKTYIMLSARIFDNLYFAYITFSVECIYTHATKAVNVILITSESSNLKYCVFQLN